MTEAHEMVAAHLAAEPKLEYRSPLRCAWEHTCVNGEWLVHRVIYDARNREVARATSRPMVRDQVTQRIERDADMVTTAMWVARYSIEGQANELSQTADAVAEQQMVQMARVEEQRQKVARLKSQLEAAKVGQASMPLPGAPVMMKYAGKVVPESEVPEHRRHLATPIDDRTTVDARVPLLEKQIAREEALLVNEGKAVDELIVEVARLQAASVERYKLAKARGDGALLALRSARIL